jgi:hypothetical protein
MKLIQADEATEATRGSRATVAAPGQERTTLLQGINRFAGALTGCGLPNGLRWLFSSSSVHREIIATVPLRQTGRWPDRK